ncbi:MAG: PAS domain S-box-containing protein [Verrucomicrobiales bacterium]|jgi:PAS domain S-box-containing protein
MKPTDVKPLDPDIAIVAERFQDNLKESSAKHDRMFSGIILVQWAIAIAIAAAISPRTWQGLDNVTHPHLIAAILLGGIISIVPAYLGYFRAGALSTRYIIASSQVMMSALLIHLTGGRIETHFHVFGSLAVLAFYRSERILTVAAAIVFIDHVVRGIFWPESVFGMLVGSPIFRSLEHACWVVFEVVFLCIAIRRGRHEVYDLCRHQVAIENASRQLERRVEERTGELKTSEEQARSLFEHAVIGLFRCTPDGKLLAANPAMVQILGYSSEAGLVSEVDHILEVSADSDENPQGADWFAKVRDHGELRHKDTVWIRKDSSKVSVRISAKNFTTEDGTPEYLEGCVEDISDQLELEERYLQAQKVQAVGQLTAGVAHDFNNILTTIIGYTDLILCDQDTDRDLRNQIIEVRKAAQQAVDLTSQLLAFSRKQTIQPTTFQLNSVVKDMGKMLNRIVGENVKTTIKLNENLPPAYADPAQVQQLLLNLAVNAKEAMTSGGCLTVETEIHEFGGDYTALCDGLEAGTYVAIAISDTGVGIAKDVMDRIFEPFFTTKAKWGGTGLGLSTCHGIAKKSGGNITVYSEVGVGTTFRVYLPCSKEAWNPQNSEEPSQTRRSMPKHTAREGVILLAEDESTIRNMGVRTLSALGYEVIAAENGTDALKKFLEHSGGAIRLVMTDVMMPEMGGIELANRILEVAPDTTILFNSGYTNDAITNTDLLENGTFFLQKPYSIISLGEKLDEVNQNVDSRLGLSSTGTGEEVCESSRFSQKEFELPD